MTAGAGLAPAPPLRPDAVTWLSLYVALLLFVPSKLIVAPLGSAGAPSMVFGLASLLLWVLFRMMAVQPTSTASQPVRIALCAFLLGVGVSYALAMSRPISPDEISPADVALLALASWSGTMLVAHDGIADRARLDTLLWRLSCCAALIALLGLVQIVTNQAWVDRISIPGLTVTEPPGLHLRGGRIRPSGTAVHPIEYGVLLSMLLPVALHVAFHQVWRARLLRWAPAATILALVPLTSSRSAYLGAAIGLAICLAGWPPQRRIRMAGVGLVGVLAMIAVTPRLLGSIIGLFTGVSDDPSIESRTASFDIAGYFLAREPWFGRGLGTFLPKYRIFDNQYAVLLVTVGIVGTALFVALGVVAVLVLLRVRRLTADPATKDLANSLVASATVGFVCLVMFDAFAFPMTMGTLFLILGVAGALRRLEASPADRATLSEVRA